MKAQILVIDDNPDVAHALKVLFTLNGMECHHAADPGAGLSWLSSNRVDLIIQDMNFTQDMTSGEEGIALFKKIREDYQDLPIILMTAWTSLETAVELVKSGASDYLSKPWDDDKLVITVQNLLELGELQRCQRAMAVQQQTSRHQLQQDFDLCGLRYQSQAMQDLLRTATHVAAAPVPVLITGPNGAGKEKIAEIIQANSKVKQGPFVKVNMGALPQDLIAAELFGAEAGAYTGISKRRIGRFEMAHGGTLFLDEIGNLPLEGQTKLLRVLESGEFERIGGNETIKVDVRIVSATNADLPDAIKKGDFREDLYYRLNLIELKLAPLNQRKADILPLAELFLDGQKQLSEEAVAVLKAHDWPGNIRELKNVMQRALLLSHETQIGAEHLGLEVTLPAFTATGEEVNCEDIQTAIKDAGGVISEAAKLLGLSRSALYRRMKKYGIEA